MSIELLGIDAGSNQVKTFGAHGADIFKSNICEWFPRNVEEMFGNDDMEYECEGRKVYAGTIAMFEDEFGSATIYGDTKAHEDTKIRVLLAIYRYSKKYCPTVNNYSIVVGQPIKGHKEAEKMIMKKMLIGKHHITVNGESRTIIIHQVGVAPEGYAAYWSKKEKGKIHIVDLGGGTCNAATIVDGMFINSASNTFNFGADTIKNKEDYNYISNGIIRNTTQLKWLKTDKVYVVGGMADGIANTINKHYYNTNVLTPSVRQHNDVKIYGAIYANAIGMYEMAKESFA